MRWKQLKKVGFERRIRVTNRVLRLLPVEHTPEQQTVQGDTVIHHIQNPLGVIQIRKVPLTRQHSQSLVQVYLWLPSVIMGSIFPVFAMLFVALGLMVCSALFVPKGPNQVTIRTALMLTFAATYLMWMVTYMAQLHPLIRMDLLVP
ncbi:hypothetical protein Ac2012v2_002326 [Leucoagaricus gongylophorus]